MLDEGCLGEHSKTILLFACFEGGVGWGGVEELGVRAVGGEVPKNTIIFRFVEGGVGEWGGA